jgi:hypothetical protein
MNAFRRFLFFALWVLIFSDWSGAQIQAQTAQPRWQAIDLGIPAGDAYSPRSVSVDESSGLAYVFGARVPESDGRTMSAVTVVGDSIPTSPRIPLFSSPVWYNERLKSHLD